MTVKEGERDDVPIQLLDPLLTSNYLKHLNQTSTSDKGNQMGIGVGEMWMGVSNLAETIIKLQEAMYKKNGNKMKVELIEEPQDVHVNSH